MPKTRDLILFYGLSLTWGIIWTLVGLFVFAFTFLFLRSKVEIGTVAGRIYIKFKEGKFGGASLGVVYLLGKHAGKRTHKHELGHTIQSMYWGPLFIPVIAVPSAIRCGLWNKIRKYHYKKYGVYPSYDSIWFEGQATRIGVSNFGDIVDNKFKS